MIMGSANIQAKIRAGLARAQNKTGSATAKKVYLVVKTNTGGNSPIDPPVITESLLELVNAIFIDYDQSLIGGNIQAGDRRILCDNVNAITQGDTIRQGATNYIVMSQEIIAPTSDVLGYMPQVRVQ